MMTIVGPASSGKTKELLMAAAKDPKNMVACKNPLALGEKAYAYGIAGVRFCSYKEAICGGIDDAHLYVDELNSFLAELKVVGYNMTVNTD